MAKEDIELKIGNVYSFKTFCPEVLQYQYAGMKLSFMGDYYISRTFLDVDTVYNNVSKFDGTNNRLKKREDELYLFFVKHGSTSKNYDLLIPKSVIDMESLDFDSVKNYRYTIYALSELDTENLDKYLKSQQLNFEKREI